MTLNRKVAATALAAAVSGLILTPAIAAADDFPRDPIQVPEGEHVYRPPIESPQHVDIIPDHARIPDLSHLPDFDDFPIHYKHEKPSESNVFTEEFPHLIEPIQLPSQAPTDSLEIPQPNSAVPPALASAVILGSAGVAVRRAKTR